MLFSLIVATLGRESEISQLLGSLAVQTIGTENFEVILVDQNEKIDLSPIVSSYRCRLNIVHIKSTRKGLSFNRNVGLSKSKADYICFPDDDCVYYPDTLKRAFICLTTSKAGAVFGAIRDRETNKNIIRDWPDCNVTLNRKNFHRLYSSITIFTRRNEIRFDENLGAGCYFGACEDTQYAYDLVRNITDCKYFPDIEVWHPDQSLEDFTRNKNISYGLGVGAFCAQNISDVHVLRFFVTALIYHLGLAFVGLLKFDFKYALARFDAFVSRARGFAERILSKR